MLLTKQSTGWHVIVQTFQRAEMPTGEPPKVCHILEEISMNQIFMTQLESRGKSLVGNLWKSL